MAFALLGIGLAGLCQLVVTQLRQVRALEKRLQGEVVQTNLSTGTSVTMLAGNTYYLVPWQNLWAQKLTGAAQVVGGATIIGCDPGPGNPPSGGASVDLIELDATAGSQDVTAYVDVTGT